MSLLGSLFGGNKRAARASPPLLTANANWRTYRAGEGDRAGRRIENVYAIDDDYIIYFIDGELYYQISETLEINLGSADALLARINRLLDTNAQEGSREKKMNVSTLELAADALEMYFCGEKTEALEILHGILEKLQAKEEAQRRLMYQAGAVMITIVAWTLYLTLQRPPGWEPWILTAALAMAGGLFSVCLTIGSLEVNVNQKLSFLFVAGTTRSVVAFLAGIALLLAMRSKMFAGIAYSGDPPAPDEALQIAEMFFCFLAGFSESFVPNILRDSEKKPAEKNPPAAVPPEAGHDDNGPAPDGTANKDEASRPEGRVATAPPR